MYYVDMFYCAEWYMNITNLYLENMLFSDSQRAAALGIEEFPLLGRVKNSRVRMRDSTFSSRFSWLMSSLHSIRLIYYFP